MYKEILRIDPVSTTKIAALLGVLWAVLGWLLNGIVLTVFLSGDELIGLPDPFSFGSLLSGAIGGFIGGAISGYLGCLVYNALAKKMGGVKVEIRE